jgi:hypothetical protein
VLERLGHQGVGKRSQNRTVDFLSANPAPGGSVDTQAIIGCGRERRTLLFIEASLYMENLRRKEREMSATLSEKEGTLVVRTELCPPPDGLG